MKDDINSLLTDNPDSLKWSENQVFWMGSALIFFNLVLMCSLSFYWMNPSFHQYISGKPL